MADAVRAVAVAERALDLAADDSEFRLAARTAHRSGSDGVALADLADRHARKAATAPAAGRLVAASRSSVVVTGKFHTDGQLKARAYLADGDRPLTVKVWRSRPGERDLGLRERTVRAAVAEIGDYRSPPVLASGHRDGVDFLLEQVVYGRHPEPGAERVAAAVELLPALAEAYVRHGLRPRRLSRIVHRDLRTRVAATLAAAPWDPRWGDRELITGRLDRLIAQNRTLPCSLGHGDLVSSNIIRTPSGSHVLIDWEFARVMPVAFDLGKLLSASGDPHVVLDGVEPALRRFDSRGRLRYRWPEQLALGVAQLLSWHPGRQARAEAAGLGGSYERELRQRLRWLAALLAGRPAGRLAG